MPGEADPNSTADVPTEHPRITGSDQASAAPLGDRRPWGRAERKRLFLWVGIGFLAPAAVVRLLPLHVTSSGSMLAVSTEVPAHAIQACFVLLATWIVARLEHRRLDDYGMPPRQAFGRRFWEGGAWGFAMLSVVLLALRALGTLRIDSVALRGGAALRYAGGWALAFLAVAVTEEFAFRGYLLFAFSRRWRFWSATALTSLLFGAAHIGNAGESVLGVLQAVLTGIVFCFAIRRTGTLWFAVGYHAAWDWGETFFYGTPDSGSLGVGRLLNTSVQGPSWLTGGSVGPEGSIIAVLALLLVLLLLHVRFPKAIYPDCPV